jgi:hypothetical protein
MSPTELQRVLERLGITPTFAAKCLGVDARTFRRWLSDDLPIPSLVARVMRAADRGRLDLQTLLECLK